MEEVLRNVFFFLFLSTFAFILPDMTVRSFFFRLFPEHSRLHFFVRLWEFGFHFSTTYRRLRTGVFSFSLGFVFFLFLFLWALFFLSLGFVFSFLGFVWYVAWLGVWMGRGFMTTRYDIFTSILSSLQFFVHSISVLVSFISSLS